MTYGQTPRLPLQTATLQAPTLGSFRRASRAGFPNKFQRSSALPFFQGTLRGALRVEGDGSPREYLGAGRSSIDTPSRPVSLARSHLGRQNRYRNPE